MNIRKTIAADIAGLSAVADATGLFPGDMVADMIAPFLAGDQNHLWMTCIQKDAVTGFTFTQAETFTDNSWNMLSLCVSPDHQRSGQGAALVAATETHLLATGARVVVVVDTAGSDDFAAGRAFYAAQGYTQCGVIPKFWAPGEDKVTFYKALT